MAKTTMSDIYRIAEKINSEGGRVRIEQAGSGGLNLYVDRINPFDGKIEKGYEAFLRGSKKDIYETLIKIRFVPKYQPYAVRSNPEGYKASGPAWAVMEFRKQMEETERLPLSERKANAVEWFRALNEDHMGVAQKIDWLLNGSYGSGSYDSACRVLASPRMNQVAWCAITIANLEWRCPARFAIQAWKKLPVEKRYLVNEAIRQEIAHAKAEGYCGEIKKNGFRYKTVVDLRSSFWNEFPSLSRKKIWVGPGRTDFPYEIKLAFREWIDQLVAKKMISESLATRAYLVGLYP